MDEVDLLDSSRDLQPIHAKSFINRLYLVLLNGKILFQKIFGRETKHGLMSAKKVLQSLCLSAAYCVHCVRAQINNFRSYQIVSHLSTFSPF